MITDKRPTTHVSPPKSRSFASLLRGAERTTILLTVGILFYIAVFTTAAFFKYSSYLMGFDLAVHEQVIWNTANGRIAETSAFADTNSYFGIDMIPFELLLAPIYALWPSTYTMLFLKTVAVGLGAIPVYLIVLDRWQSAWAGLVFAALLLLYLPVQYTNLYEFQIRAFATTFLLWAFYALERRQFRAFLIWSLLALGCRSDVGLVLIGMGLYALYDERQRVLAWVRQPATVCVSSPVFAFGLLPMVLGLGWFVLALEVLVPLFRDANQPSLYLAVIYNQFGDSTGEIIRTVLTRPDYVLSYVFFSEQGPERIRYLLGMFLPFAFLLLLQPRMLLITLPIFGLNLLSNTPHIHADIQKHYQTLIVPFMVIGSAYGLHWLLGRLQAGVRWHQFALGGLVVLALASNAGIFRGVIGDRGYVSPFLSLLTRDIDHAKIAAIDDLLAQVPPDAALTTSNKIGPYAAQRERIFFFPGNVIYPKEKTIQGDYLLIDHDNIPGDIRAQLTGSEYTLEVGEGLQATYQRLAVEQEVSLWRKVE